MIWIYFAPSKLRLGQVFVAHAFNPSIWQVGDAEVIGSLWVPGQPDLQIEFQDFQSYREKPCLVKTNKTNSEPKQQQQTQAGV